MQDDFSMPLIHTACRNGEMDTLSELIEMKGVDPCLVDEVSTDIQMIYCRLKCLHACI